MRVQALLSLPSHEEAERLQACTTVSGFTWPPRVQAQALTRVQQALHPISHHPRPKSNLLEKKFNGDKYVLISMHVTFSIDCTNTRNLK